MMPFPQTSKPGANPELVRGKALGVKFSGALVLASPGSITFDRQNYHKF